MVKQMIKEVDATELKSQLAAGREIYLLDIRSAGEVARGVLPNSQHLPMHLLPLRMGEFPADKDVVLYCHSGQRSYHACSHLMGQGFDNVINLRGGILDWARSGFEVVAAA
jgi:rhodanese-related sulfurtransferase